MKNNIIRFFKSFRYAGRGISKALMTQQNIRFHIVAVVFVMLLSLFYDFTATQYVLLMLTFSSVIACELINTAIETVVDLCSPEYNELAKIAKDVAAGAVLVSAAFSVIIAFLLFFDINVFKRIGLFFTENPEYIAGVALLIVISFIFVFGDTSKK